MLIRDLRTVIVDAERGRTWLFIEVHTDAGLVGVGEASQSRSDSGVAEQVSALRSHYVDQDPLDLIERSTASLLRTPFAGRIRAAAVSGIEQALWDLVGKATGQPVYRLLGGKLRDRIRLYANLNAAKRSDSPEELAQTAARAVAEGFTAVKIYPFGQFERTGRAPGTPLTREERSAAIDRVRAVREAIGPYVDLLTDWAWALLPADARDVAVALEPFDLYWIEEPYVTCSPQPLTELRSRLLPRLAAGEQLTRLRDFAALFEAGAIDVAMPDVKWIGGISGLRKVATLAESRDVEIAPHNMSGPVATAASLQVAVGLSNCALLEYCWGAVPWRNPLVRDSETIVDGHLVLGKRPGLGIDWDGHLARRHAP